MFPSVNGDLSGIQILMIIGAVFTLAGIASGPSILFLAIVVWAIFVLLTLLRQF